jgi:hypothetical protein
VIESLEHANLAALQSFVAEVAAAATSRRLVGSDPALADCGFVESEGGWVREVTVAPVSEELTQAITLGELEDAIRASWCAETSDDPECWTTDNPAYQQCDVTSRVVQDYWAERSSSQASRSTGVASTAMRGTGSRRA